MRIALVSTVLFLSAGTALAQTREAGPWWPNPTWGRGDQAGASNWITPEKVLEAARLVKTGKVYEIGQVYEKSMPMFGARTYALLSPGSPTYSFPGRTASSETTSSCAPRSARLAPSSTGLGTSG